MAQTSYGRTKTSPGEKGLIMNTLNVAVVSSNSKFCDVEANVRHFETLIKKASEQGARLVCFPELALTSYTTAPESLVAAEKIPGPLTDELTRIAKRNSVFISAGVAEKAGSRYYVAQLVVGPKGYLGKFRKYHPTDGEEGAGFSPGKTFPTFEIDGFKMGINICFDGRHQDTIDAMKKRKVDFIHHPHGNGLGLGKNAEEWTRAKMTYFVPRAIYSRAYILVNNSSGNTKTPHGTATYGSGALVLDPLGQAIARTTQKTRSEKMVLATLVKPLSEVIPEFELEREA